MEMEAQHVASFCEKKNSDEYTVRFIFEIKLGPDRKLENNIVVMVNCNDDISVLYHNIHEAISKRVSDTDTVDDIKELISNINDIKLYRRFGGTRELKNTNIKSLFKEYSNKLNLYRLRIQDIEYKVLLNGPFITELTLPPIILAGYPVKPVQFRALCTDETLCKYFWYKSKNKVNWKRISSEHEYLVDGKDIGYYLKLVCQPKNTFKDVGECREVISDCKVDKMLKLSLDVIRWRHGYTQNPVNNTAIRVMSYNTLAERYTTFDKFPDCPPRALSIHYRKQMIAIEIFGYKADIVCLQEVDQVHYTDYFFNKFKENDYMAMFNRKGNYIAEGLVCAFKRSKFTKYDKQHIVFKNVIGVRGMFKQLYALVKRNKMLHDTFMRQATSLQVIVLKSKARKNEYVIVGNTHLFYRPDADDVRLIQANMAAIFLANLRQQLSSISPKVSVILCGDFNSSPKKTVYPFLINRTLDPRHPDCLKIAENGKAKLKHELGKLLSACGTPKYTNYTNDFKDCLDYIFVQSNRFTIKQVIPMSGEKQLSKFKGLPNEYYPSDHLALVVDLEYKQ